MTTQSMFEILNPTGPAFEGWYRLSDEESPKPEWCTVGVAVTRGWIARHQEAGFLHHFKIGKLSLDAAVEMELLDQKAADYIARLPQPYRSIEELLAENTASAALRSTLPPTARPGTLEYYEGTPGKAVAEALQRYVSTRGLDDLVKFTEAVNVAITGTKGGR